MTDADRRSGPAVPRVRLVDLTAGVLTALADGDLAKAGELAGVEFGPEFLAERWLWDFRLAQLTEDPGRAGWLTYAVVDAGADAGQGRPRAVGNGGYHGPPDADGMVEIGYAIHPDRRRRGYGRATVAELLRRAAALPEVATVRAAIRPDNAASLATIAGFGFAHVGEQWDEIDGLEYIYERPATDFPRDRET
ncbi:GNAT family N-acetyltransferase [Nocardiopsis sp. CNR-923]|uniref:GNAT family N-acetyltransferase n=1 Tax=Nocardiopsis sp. CNR-923 TaxID=1904965 RepID=UPI00095A1EAD|nr:GNAT family N-acetyltransferase [Nocardiopsis sp. CNR-923]OLT27961.1 GNAT family N-acetyltransferase [Nocardiopsis sp. CNR-923]